MATLWRNRSFTVLFTAQVISLAGSGVTTVALALLVRQLAGSAAAATVLGEALTLRILAFLLFSQPAGILADRINRKALLIGSDLARFALMAAFPFITQVWQVYVAVFVVNALTAFFTPAYEASLPEVVGEEHYVKALAYSRVAIDVEAVGGPVLAGLLVAAIGLRWVFWFDALTYVASAILVSCIRIPSGQPQASALKLGDLLQEVTHGTRVLLREPAIRQALLMSLAEATAGACAIVITVVYVQDVLLKSTMAFTLVMAGVGLGSSLAAMLLSRRTARLERQTKDQAQLHGIRHRWSSRTIFIGGWLAALSLLPGILQPPLLIFGLLWILNGAGQALIAIPGSTLVAEHTSPTERGRAFAAHFALTHLCWLITYPATGYLASRVGPGRAFTLCGAACLGIMLCAALLGRGTQQAHTHDRH